MAITLLFPTCNLVTVRDGRGGIFTWRPIEPIVEFNLLYFQPGKVRGFHSHPEFVEYLLVVDGNGVLVTPESPGDPTAGEKVIHLAKGTCTRADIGTSHTVYAITELTIVAMLTKAWDDCTQPIIRDDEEGG